MKTVRIIFTFLATACLFVLHAETSVKLTPTSQTNVLGLLPAGLQAPENRVLDAAVAGDSIYFLVGSPYTRREKGSIILRWGSDGSADAKLLPPGEVRSLSIDSESNVHALMLPERRGTEPKMITCHPSLASCSTAAFADEGRQVWARQFRAGHVLELSFDGALFLDGTRLLAAPRTLSAMIEPTKLLSTPGDPRAVYLNQASGALSVIDATQASALQSSRIEGKEFAAVRELDNSMRGSMPPEGRSGALTIYAAALSADGSLFAALSPYKGSEGALVIQTSLDGTTKRAIRCELPSAEAGTPAIHPVHIGVKGNNLVLVSERGDVLTYSM